MAGEFDIFLYNKNEIHKYYEFYILCMLSGLKYGDPLEI